LKSATSDTYFLANSLIYQQIDGVAMGSPLGPALANIFMAHLETKFNASPVQPLSYIRYVDDTFCTFNNPQEAQTFLNYLNSLHHKIKFTIEHESNQTLPFLDTLVHRSPNAFTTSVFRKPYYSPLTTNFYSFNDLKYKINAASTLIRRAFTHSSTYLTLHKEWSHITSTLTLNNFAPHFIESLINKYLDNIYNPKPTTTTPQRLPIYIKYKYSGHNFHPLTTELRKLIAKFYPQIQFHLVPINHYTISSFFKFKDVCPSLMRASVVYSYSCPGCQLGTYIGSTRRRLKERISEHIGISHRTNTPLTNPPFSPIRTHASICGIPPTPDHFTILTQTHPSILPTFESLYIKLKQPTLNIDASAAHLYVS
jgi:hypothetical protein